MPAHIPASIGRGALPLVEKINNGKASKLDQVITNQPTRPLFNTLVFAGKRALWRKRITTNKLENQLTPRSSPQERIYAHPHPGQCREGGAPPGGENQQWQSIQIGTSYYRPTYTAGGLVSINLCNWMSC